MNKPKYIIDSDGIKTHVILPIDDYLYMLKNFGYTTENE